jgi:hypothetical protein
MIKITIWLIAFLFGLLGLVYCFLSGNIPTWVQTNQIPITCAICGGFGGNLYCLRAIYLNYCVKKTWDPLWYAWYVIRPIVSMISGGVSCLFLKAGLLVLEAQPNTDSSYHGYHALAFIAGLNVDKFISKIEDIAQATWGIEKSRASKGE